MYGCLRLPESQTTILYLLRPGFGLVWFGYGVSLADLPGPADELMLRHVPLAEDPEFTVFFVEHH